MYEDLTEGGDRGRTVLASLVDGSRGEDEESEFKILVINMLQS
jgi:hypothetical protein